ncbi:hypothetical protein COHCIP112018_05430 [Cohnella sp. JJ-181]|nr:hypothetical protein COHCIP112018_05430 [Cohnella sp. JJ-181]
MTVVLLQKLPDGQLRKIDERLWTRDMLNALHHVNYLTVGSEEYETIEGRLDVEQGIVELLLVPVRKEKSSISL